MEKSTENNILQPERDSLGRFVKGHKGRTGRKEHFSKVFLKAIKDEDVVELVKQILAGCASGDVRAQKLILDKILPKDVQHVSVETAAPVDLSAYLENNLEKLTDEDAA